MTPAIGGSTSGGAQTDESTGRGRTTGTGPTTTSGADSTSSGNTNGPSDGDTGGDDGCPFLECVVDIGEPSCDVFAQDCRRGEKCTAWARQGGSWNATRCVAVVEDPVGAGDTCQVEGTAVSGDDNCDATSMCFHVDTATLQGTCVETCAGTPLRPQCDEALACFIANEGVLALCLLACTPDGDDCPRGQACYPADDEHVCLDEVPPSPGAYGTPCSQLATCDPGLTCVVAEHVPNCEDTGCCTEYCDVDSPNTCPDADVGQICIATADVGVCGMPG
ncbi:MAG: hypothetical protein JKY37_07210 [Nannocystaceae bacterium]|nr:hypothetical protein [Nannocystaceae bacterium]